MAKPRENKDTHEDGKLHVVYEGPTGGLEVAGMVFPQGVETRLSPTKVDRIPDEYWKTLRIVRPR